MRPSEQQHTYLEDTYRLAVATDVLAVERHENRCGLVLRKNLFHPQGGGQPADIGTVQGHLVQAIRVTGGEVVVEIADKVHLRPGDQVQVEIDQETRLRHAALHTAGHLIDAVLRRRGFTHRSSNHFPHESRVEVIPLPDFDTALTVIREDLLGECLTLISEKPPVTISTDSAGRRLVTLEGIGTDPCGGTHLHSLAQIDRFDLRGVKHKKGILKVGYNAEHRATV